MKKNYITNKNKKNTLYYSNDVAWMTKEIFHEYLTDINRVMINQKRLILLLCDNANVHNLGNQYSDITVHYIPPNTSVLIQPIDMGVVNEFKSHYKKYLNSYIISYYDNEHNKGMKIKLPIEYAISWVKSALESAKN